MDTLHLMFNPFELFEARYVPLFEKKGIKVFVMQSYPRGKTDYRTPFVFTYFNNPDFARNHFDVIQRDPNRRMFSMPEQKNDLLSILNDRQNICFVTLFRADAGREARKLFDKGIKAYIARDTNWHPRNSDEVVLKLIHVFGKVRAELSWNGERHRTDIDDIERMAHVL